MNNLEPIKPNVGASPGAKFRLLMWKNFLIQWRHPKHTAAELLVPVLAMSLILVLRSQIGPFIEKQTIYPAIDANSMNYSRRVFAGMNTTELAVAYSPKSKVLQDVLHEALARMIADNIYDLKAEIKIAFPKLATFVPSTRSTDFNNSLMIKIIKTLVKIDEYDSGADLSRIYVNEDATRRVIAAVEFHDSLLGATKLTNNLSYALRFPEKPRLNSFFLTGGRSWKTRLLYPPFPESGPRYAFSHEGGDNPGYVNELFIALQHYITMELISRRTGVNVRDFKIQIHRFPHPPFIYDAAILVLKLLFPLVNVLSFSYTAINISRAITLEKELQLKETMKIMGLPAWLNWTALFLKYFIILLFTTTLIVILLKVNWFSNKSRRYSSVFINTPWTVLWFTFITYVTTIIFLSFMVSSMCSKASIAALSMGVIWFLMYLPSLLLAIDESLPKFVQVLLCININTAISYGFQVLLSEESNGGLQWDQFFYSAQQDNPRLLFGHVVMILFADCIVYLLVALYLEQVRPGPYGTPQPWNFILKKKCWFKRHVTETGVPADEFQEESENIVRESDPKSYTVGVKIKNLSKKYGKNIQAVNNLSLTVYNDQITVLLGPNGAGKTTTVSMLTGNVSPSSGSIWLAGYDVRRQLREARAQVGLCPQHNVLFPELTVQEHLHFFGKLKGLTGHQLTQEIDMLIKKLGLEEKRNYKSGGLSGGQKRRLSVGIALCGGAKVVLLDEPTSGMDPSSRRALWELLQNEKKGRALILTTHFMDEADYLGDRIAIMSAGRLQCVGSPYFLKRHYGVGYTLVVEKGQNFNPEVCTDLIKRYISGVDIKEDRGLELTYLLPNECSSKYEELLIDLEKCKNDVGYNSYGLLSATLEDVFIKVTSEGILPTSTTEYVCADETSLIRPAKLYWQQIYAIWLKLWLVWSRSRGLLILQILVPLFIINFTLATVTFIATLFDEIIPRPLTLEKGFTLTETLIAANDSATITQSLMKSYKSLFTNQMKLTLVEGQSIQDYFLNKSSSIDSMKKMRQEIVIGATFSNNSIEAWFSNFGFHDVAISLATVHRAILKSLDPTAEMYVTNHPLEVNYANSKDMAWIIRLITVHFAQGLANSLSIISAVFVMFYIRERVTGAKLLQSATGVTPIVMWGSVAVYDWIWFMTISFTFILSCAIFQVLGLTAAPVLGRLFFLIMIYAAVMLPAVYVLSFLFQGVAFGFVVVFFMNAIFGLISAQIVNALWQWDNAVAPVTQTMDGIFQFYPIYNLITSVQRIHELNIREWFCKKSCGFILKALGNSSSCTKDVMCQLNPKDCCVRDNPFFDWEHPGVLRYLICMMILWIIFWGLLFTIEYGFWKKVFRYCRHKDHKRTAQNGSHLDEDVLEEINHVKSIPETDLKQFNLIARELTKYYKKNLAVNQVSFSVRDNECFGLLGENGAGKTTTFKMLMGDELVSSGDAFVRGQSVINDIKNVHRNIGYCPQFDAVFQEMTGRENLRFFALLRGFKQKSIPSLIQHLADSLGFTKHLDKRVHQYSGGNKRKLSTAVALMGYARVVFLDEPTTGVDPAARRQVWTAIRKATQSGKSVVLTSHSMEECEALCSRLTIMVNGQFKCLGTPQHLKNKFSHGFILTIKLKTEDDPQTNIDRTAGVKDFVTKNFLDVKLMEEYQGLLTYYLQDRSMPWSRMFGIMERAKRELQVEDYTISQTTLEQIFLQFTKYQQGS